MKKAFLHSLALVGLGSCVILGSAMVANAEPVDRNDPKRILNLLTEKERTYLESKDKSKTTLDAEELAHVGRVLRLYQIELERSAEEKAEDAQIAAAQVVRERQMATGGLVDEVASLRTEINRLNLRLSELQPSGIEIREAAGAERPQQVPIR